MRLIKILGVFAVLVSSNMQLSIAQCTIADVFLGNDTTICSGSSLQLNAGSGYSTYLWDNGSINQTRLVSNAGTYHVKVGNVSSINLITNGDFEAGGTGFTTSYVVGVSGSFGPLSNAGTYAITTSPNLVHNNFMACEDHTTGVGNKMLVVNGAGTPNANVWCQNVTVDPNTDYQFATWVSSALNDNNVAQLQFSINNTPFGTVFSPSTLGCSWGQFYEVWNSGINTTAQICILNQNTNTGGNDFMIDDISFSPLCFEYDTIQITSVPKPVITVSPNDTICSGQSAQLTANSVTPDLVYTWTPGNLSGQSVTVSPTASAIYSVTGTSTFGCVSNIVSTAVLVRPSPVLTWTVSTDTVCAGEPVQFNTSSNIAFTTFSYSPTTGIDGILIASPTQTTTYTVTGTSPIGCQSTLSQTITVIPPTVVNITGELTFCEGSQTVLTGSSNQTGTILTWLPSGTTGNSFTVNDNNIGMVVLSGSYLNCPLGYDTVTTAFKANPSVFVPNDQIICAGESTSATVSSNQPGATFVWMPGNLTGATQVLQPTATTTYTVVAQYDGCVSAPETFVLDLSGACSLEVPNVFTPNADQVNDSFGLLSQSGITTLNCTIINRWGNVIRTFDKPNFSWDGTDNANNQVTAGIYFYTITATTSGGLEFTKHGFIHLIR